MKRCLMALCLVASGAVAAQVPPHLTQSELNMVNRIRAEAFDHSHVMDIEKHLTEVIGPRLTNSPQNIAANAWARKQFTEWGLSNVHSEAFPDFGRGWEYTYSSVQMLSPHQKSLFALPKAWTPGTNGWVEGEAMMVSIESPEDLDKYKGKLAGKIVLLDPPRDFNERRPDKDPEWQRYSAADLAAMHDYEVPGESGGRLRSNPDFMKRYRAYMELRKVLPEFLQKQGVLATISISRHGDGVLGVSSGGSPKAADAAGVPGLVMAAERYNEVARAVERGDKVKLRINVKARFTDQTDQPGHNTLAEIPGTGSKRHEVVMLGAHLDSWHAGTGAADNGAGVAVVMEAMRILKKLGVQPHRTIRAALWSGEEEGLIGSRAYVSQHFAEWKAPDAKGKQKDVPWFMEGKGNRKLVKKDGYDKLDAYFNLDNGSGRIRGIYAQQNMAVMPIFAAWLKPFHDVGATDVVSGNTGSTDHIAFDAVGLPGFQFIQDKLDYFTKIHHTNLDTLEHVSPADLKQAAAIMATFVYLTAQRDQMLPRKPLATN